MRNIGYMHGNFVTCIIKKDFSMLSKSQYARLQDFSQYTGVLLASESWFISDRNLSTDDAEEFKNF